MFEVSNSSTAPRSNSASIFRTRSRRYWRRRSKSTRISQSTPMIPGAGLVATGNSSMSRSLLVVLRGQRVLEVGPVADEAVGVAAGGLGRLRLQPPDPAVADVAEPVDASDAGPRDVARPEVEGLAVEGPLDLP